MVERETQIIMQSFACRSSSPRTESRWSGTPPRTAVSQVPQVPSAHEDRTPTPASSTTDRMDRSGGTVSVMGYDDSRIARLASVDLTSVAQDVEQLTTLAVRRALDRLDGAPAGPRELVVPPRLVVRSTTAPPG